jgi:hypothetical protein
MSKEIVKMEDKVIHEFKIIETEDGFRIEIKGDKERIRRMGFGPFGRFRGGHHRHDSRARHGRHFRFEKHFGWGPPWWWYEEEEENRGEPEEPSEKV